jgi:hypothetical protein
MQLPLFPLDVFLLPGERTKLHIFEPRYKQLIKDCLAQPVALFGIPFFSVVNTANYCSIVRIVNAYNYNDLGECDIDIVAVDVAIVTKFEHQKTEGILYPYGNLVELKLNTFQEVPADITELLPAISDWQNHEVLIDRQPLSLTEVFLSLNPNVLDKLEFVARKDDAARVHYLRQFIQYFRSISEQESSVYANFYLN